MKKSVLTRLTALLLTLTLCFLFGCEASDAPLQNPNDLYSYDEAISELESKVKKIHPTEVKTRLDLDIDTTDLKTLADIDTFKITVQGHGNINVEIAAPSELSGDAPDDFINVIARKFNDEHFQINNKSISVSIRNISSGEVVTYMTEGDYRPDGYIPSSYSPMEMLRAKGIDVIKLTDRIAGNTAGILMKREVYDNFIAKYGDVTVDKVLDAALAQELIFGYTNPYTSNTGLDMLAAMLHSFDPSNPLSEAAAQKLIEYQKIAPSAAYTTGILRNQAAKNIIDAMVMEEQAFINLAELRSNYVFTPAGIRHDHPVCTFSYVDTEKQQVMRKFVEYCLSDKSQRLASEKGFNLHDEYIGQDPGLDGSGYLAVQKVWKANKDGGKPVIAVFIADISGSMNDNSALEALKQSLLATSKYISSDNYIGLVSYSDKVFVNLKINQFDDNQRSFFSCAVKDLSANGGTATYDAVLVALQMLHQKSQEIPDAKMMLFVLSDGDSRHGNYSLNNITNIVAGMRIPIYTIGYNLETTGSSAERQLRDLSNINEATLISTDTDGIVNQLRNLFNVQL